MRRSRKGTKMMKNDNNMLTREQFEAEIIKKAWKDPEYKKRLLESPKEVLEEELGKIVEGVRFPENFEVSVHEETPYSIHLVLPVNPADYAGDEEGVAVRTETAGQAEPVGPVVLVNVVPPVPIVNMIVPPNVNSVYPSVVNVVVASVA